MKQQKTVTENYSTNHLSKIKFKILLEIFFFAQFGISETQNVSTYTNKIINSLIAWLSLQ